MHSPRIVLFVAALFAGVGCGSHPQPGISVESPFRSYISPDATALLGIRLDSLRKAPLYIRHESQLNFSQLNRFFERTGLDLRRDLSNVLVVFNGRHSLLLATGSFNQSDIETHLTDAGASRMEYKRHTLLTNREEAVAFLEKDLIAAGPISTLESAMDLHDSHDGQIPEELQQRMRAIPGGDQLWAVTRGSLSFADLSTRTDLQSALSNIVDYISATSIGIGVDTGLHLRAEIVCISDQGAQRVRDALRGAIGLGRLTTKDGETDLLRLYDSIQVEQNGQTVQIRSDLPSDLADKLLTFSWAKGSISRLR